MGAQTVWVVLAADQVAQQLRELIDRGMLAEANSYSYYLQSYLDQIKTFVQSRGGHLALHLYDRCVMEIPLSAAEELPEIVADYQERFKHKLAVGVGVTLSEASQACERSYYTKEIELFEPGNDDYQPNIYQKAEDMTEPWEVSPNLFCPKTPSPEDNKKQLLQQPEPPQNPVLRPDLAREMESEAKLIAAINQQLAPPAAGQPGDQKQQQPRDLLEALHGGPIPGRNSQASREEAMTAPESGGQQVSAQGVEVQQAQQQIAAEVDEAEEEAEEQSNQRLAQLLATVKQNLPQIMNLHETNPEAFSQAMKMISKLVQLAHSRKRTEKKELSEQTETLEKAFRRGIGRWIGRTRRKYPVGTRIGRRIKVLIDGKERWRSVGAGQVQDRKGSAISVRSSNYYAEQPSRDPDSGLQD